MATTNVAAILPKSLSGVQLHLSWVPPDVQLPTLRLTLLFLLWITLLLPGLPRTGRPQCVLTPMSRRAPIRTAPGRGPAGT